MERTYHITRRADGMWEAREAGKPRAILNSQSQAEITEDIFELGKELGDVRVLVHAADGALLEERTFASRAVDGAGPSHAEGIHGSL